MPSSEVTNASRSRLEEEQRVDVTFRDMVHASQARMSQPDGSVSCLTPRRLDFPPYVAARSTPMRE